MFSETEGPGVYCIPHIAFLAIMIPLLALGIILSIYYVKSEKANKLLIKITAGVLLALIITNRIAYTYQRVEIERLPGYTWGYLLPETFCGLSALFLSITVLVGKKDNILLHALVYFGLVNGVASTFFPVYLDRQGFFEVGTLTSLIFHVVLVFLSLTIILKKYMTPSIKKWYIVPLVYGLFCLIGLFEIQVLDTPAKEAMSLFEPLVSALPTLTSWYMLGIEFTVLMIIVLFTYEHFANQKTFKQTAFEFIHFYRYINK